MGKWLTFSKPKPKGEIKLNSLKRQLGSEMELNLRKEIPLEK